MRGSPSSTETARATVADCRRCVADVPIGVAPRLRDYLLRRGFSTSIVVRRRRETTGVAAEE